MKYFSPLCIFAIASLLVTANADQSHPVFAGNGKAGTYSLQRAHSALTKMDIAAFETKANAAVQRVEKVLNSRAGKKFATWVARDYVRANRVIKLFLARHPELTSIMAKFTIMASVSVENGKSAAQLAKNAFNQAIQQEEGEAQNSVEVKINAPAPVGETYTSPDTIGSETAPAATRRRFSVRRGFERLGEMKNEGFLSFIDRTINVEAFVNNVNRMYEAYEKSVVENMTPELAKKFIAVRNEVVSILEENENEQLKQCIAQLSSLSHVTLKGAGGIGRAIVNAFQNAIEEEKNQLAKNGQTQPAANADSNEDFFDAQESFSSK